MNVTEHVNALCKRANPKIRQQMLTVPITRAIPALYAQEEVEEKIAYLKFFGSGRWTWYACEATPFNRAGSAIRHPVDGKLMDLSDQIAMYGEICDVEFFGYVVSGLGEDCDEFGYFRLMELVEQSFPPFGLPIERDIHFSPVVLRDELRDRWGVAA